MGGTKSLGVEETGLPGTTRHSFQSGDANVTQFDASRSDFVLCVVRVDNSGFHFLKIWSVRRAGLERGGARTSIKFFNCLEISSANFARLIPCGTTR